MKNYVLRALAAWLLVPPFIGVGQLSEPSPKPESPILKVTTRLVQVNAIVQDKKGMPVPDLTRDDFILLEDNKEQPISVFSVETSQALPASLKPLPPHTFSNRLEYHANTPTSVTVILLDGLNTRFEDQAYAKNQIIKFLQQLEPQDRVALYALGRTLHVLHDFTSDAAPLLRSLARYRGRISTELEASEPGEPDTGNTELDTWLRDSNQQMADFYTRNRARNTLNALEAIANHLAKFPGRKNLVWVSGSFPYSIGFDVLSSRNPAREQHVFSSEISRTGRALSNANVAIYPVDARGLIAVPAISADKRTPPSLPSTSTLLGPIGRSHDTMNALAEGTGGRAFYNSNDLKGAIRRAIEDARVTYVLGYYPTHGKWDGKFHEIKLKVNRPGLSVRYRRGYFAFPAQARDEKQRQAALRDAVWSPLDATGVGLMIQVKPPEAGAKRPIVAIQIDRRDISLEAQDNRWAGALDVFIVPQTADGRDLKGTSDTVNLHLTQVTYEEIVKEGLILTRHVEVPKQASRLRIIVRDLTSGAIGSLSIPADQFPKPGN